MLQIKIKRLVASILCIAIIFSYCPTLNAASIPSKYLPYVVDGRVDYKELYSSYFRKLPGNDELAPPTASFTVTVKRGGAEVTSGNSDSGDILYAQVGDTLTITNTSTPSSGNSLTKCDFQVSNGTSIINGGGTTNLGQINLSSIDTSKEGIYNIYLNVMDNSPLNTEGWGNWDYNGSHRSPGTNPGGGTGSDFPGWWYYSKLTIDIKKPTYTLDEKHIVEGTSTVLYSQMHKDITTTTKSTSKRDFSGYEFAGSRAGYSWDDIANGPTENIATRTANFSSSNPNAFHYYYYKKVVAPGSVYAEFTIYSGGEDVTDRTFGVDALPASISTVNQSVGDIKTWQWEIKSSEDAGYTVVVTTKDMPAQALSKEIQYTVKLTVSNGINTHSTTHTCTPKKGVVTPPPPSNSPPTAVIRSGSEVAAGDKLYVDGRSSYDSDGSIVEYLWEAENPDAVISMPVSESTGYFIFKNNGEHVIYLTVFDNEGDSGWEEKTITVKPPYPQAVLNITGKLKENREVKLDSAASKSPASYPIDASRTVFSIQPISGGTAADIKYSGSLTGSSIKSVLFKKAGRYKVTLTVTNTYGLSSTTTSTVDVSLDLPPAANFSTANKILRDPADSNYGTIKIADLTTSSDGDTISNRVWQYKFDSDNDGSFADESWTVLSNANITNPQIRTNRVGKYLIELQATEAFSEPTLSEFLLPGDIKSDNTDDKALAEKTVEVINTAPVLDFELRKKKPVDIVVMTDFEGTKYTNMLTQLNTLRSELLSLNVDANFTIVNSKVKMGSLTDTKRAYRRYGTFYYRADYDWWSSNGNGGYSENKSFTSQIPWEERIEYESNTAALPKRNPQNVSYSVGSMYTETGRTTYYEKYPVTITCTNDIKTYGTTSFTAVFENNGGSSGYIKHYPRNFGAGVDSIFTPEEVISVDTSDFYTVDMGSLSTIPLRTDSDRYLLFVGDNGTKGFLKGWGNYYAFSGLTETHRQYIKNNRFKVYSVSPELALDAWIKGEKVLDVAASGQFGFIKTMDGTIKSLGTTFETSSGYAYPVDRGNFGTVVDGVSGFSYGLPFSYLLMSDGRVKQQRGISDTFDYLPIWGVTDIMDLEWFRTSDGNICKIDGQGVLKNYYTSGIVKKLHPKDTWYTHPVFITSAGELKYLGDDGTVKPIYQRVYYNGRYYYYPITSGVKDWEYNCLLKTDGTLYNAYLYNDTTGWSVPADQFNTPIQTGVSWIKDVQEGLTFVQYMDGTAKAYWLNEYFTGRYNRDEEPIYRNQVSLMTLPYRNMKEVITPDNSNLAYVLTESKQLYAHYVSIKDYSNPTTQAYLVATDVEYFDGHILKKNDGKIYYFTAYKSSYSTPTYNLYEIKIPAKVKKIVTRDYLYQENYYNYNQFTSYLLTEDNDLYGFGNSEFGQLGQRNSGCFDYNNPKLAVISNGTLAQPELPYVTLRDIISDSLGNKVFGAGQFGTAVNDIISTYSLDPSYTSNYLLLNDEADLNMFYSDYESDPEYTKEFYYNHEPNYFDNGMGLHPQANKTILAPILKFDRVGKFAVNVRARDNPYNDDRFDNYRLWSRGDNTVTLYVHRKPIAVIKLNIADNHNGTYKMEATDGGSYDLDHSISRADKGIAAREWRWKEKYDIYWHSERMNKPDCTPDKQYIIQLRVKDIEGVWSDYSTVNVDQSNPPVALYEITDNPLFIDQRLQLKDLSYPRSLCSITRWHWIVKKLNADGSAPISNIQNAAFTNSNAGTGGYDNNVKTNYADTGVGVYRIYLRVKSDNNKWSDGGTDSEFNLESFYHQDLVVMESFKLSGFRVAKVKDKHLEGFYYDAAAGEYVDRPIGVAGMAVDERNFAGIAGSLTKGYVFEFEIDSANFNDDNDEIIILPHFYTCDSYFRDAEERDIYWENSRHEIIRIGEGAHLDWKEIRLTREDRQIEEGNKATWRGSYLIPGTAWAVAEGTTADCARAARINRDIIVNFEIKGYKGGLMKYDYNLQQWPAERNVAKHPYEIGDVIRYSHIKNNLDDSSIIINRP